MKGEDLVDVRRVAQGAIFGATILAIIWTGLLTNWFRYFPSLEGTIALAPIVVATPLALLFLGVAASTRRRWGLVVGIGVFALGALAALMAHREAFGGYLPGFSKDHVESSGTAELKTSDGTVRYWLELHNPFARSHREVLVVQRGSDTHRFELPIFDEESDGFGGALEPEDWVVMSSTPDKQIFSVSIGKNLLVSKTFRVNLATGEVVASGPPSN
ncbi:MAG TPA: hypothetical protein VF701_18060 [Thermoanaerobaculia bacterium]